MRLGWVEIAAFYSRANRTQKMFWNVKSGPTIIPKLLYMRKLC